VVDDSDDAGRSVKATRAAARPWTSAQLLLAATVLAVLAAAALAADIAIAQWMKDHGLRGELKRLVHLSETFGWGGTVALIVLTAAVLDPRGWRVIPPLAVSAFGAGGLADGIKLFVSRLRPSAADLSDHFSKTFIHATSQGARGYPVQSFPSSHAATAAGLAAALAMLYPRGRWLFATFAVLAGLQRIEAQAHFASDALAGAAIGCLVAAACQRFCCRSNCAVS